MDLEIVGRHALLFDDDFQSAFVNSREALVPWNENQSLFIDRYDVRHLLSSIPPPSSRTHPGRVYIELEADGLSRSDLNRERYLDLPEDEPDDAESGFKGAALGEDVINGTYQAVPFSYGDNDGSISNSKADVGSDYSGYHPCFPLPEYLLRCLPPTEKLHQIIARTAMFVSKHGGQSEIVLRVKQGDNPTFGFLMPTHHLHAYFRYLVEHPNLLNICPVDTRDEKNMLAFGENESRFAGEALSSLGSLYGSLDEDESLTQEPSDQKQAELGNPDDTNTGDLTQQIIKEELSVPISGRETKYAPYKDSTLSLKKNLPIVAPNSISVTSKAKAKTDPLDTSPSKAYSSTSNIQKLIVEPPSTMKEAISKIVEFILRNGREFETVLIEQDRSHGRFPFLLPTNLYHAYYLKVLHEAQELKRLDKKPSDQKHDSHQKLDGSRKSHERYGSASQSSASQSEGLYDPQRKEKFKMVIGGGKKDSPEPSPVPAKDSGVSVDVAAAIVMAATRGLSSPMEFQKSNKPTEFQKSVKPSAISADMAAKIVMAATRGSRSPPESDNPSTTIARESGRVLAPDHSRPSSSFGSLSTDMAARIVMAATRGSRSPPESYGPSTTIVRDSASVLAPGQSRPSSSFGSLSALQSGSISISGRVSNIAPSCSIPRISPISNNQLEGKCISGPDSVKVANAMAKNVALAAASEADSSEASMTKEQKLKAERLKRAKLFTSLIRSGGPLLPASVEQIESHIAGSGSAISGSVSDLSRREREGSSVPVDAGSPHNSDEKDSSHGIKHRSRKHSSRTRGSDDDFEEYSRKKHHSESDRKERRHKRHKHQSLKASKHESSEDELLHRKGSSSGHCHYRHGDTFDEEYHGRSDSHGRRKAHTERKQPVHKQEEMATILEEPDCILTKSKSAGSEGIAPTSISGSQPDNTGISDDLRAKVRAMLMATL